MRPMITIVSTGLCAGLLALSAAPTMGQEPIDTSQTRTMTVVWKQQMGSTVTATSYLPNFGGRPGFDVLTTSIRARGNQTWATRPKLDTTNIFNWHGINSPVHIRELDYDGIPPHEYVNSAGIIWRCASKDQPLPLVPIDTVTYQTCIGVPQISADVDGDGFLDVITDVGGDDKTCRIVMGGPQSGKGCERVFPIERFGSHDYRATRAFFRSTTGKWRVVQYEADNDALSTALVIYDVDIIRQDGRVQVRAVKRDSLIASRATVTATPQFNCAALADTVSRRDWLYVYRSDGLRRIDITSGSFVPTGEVVTGYSELLVNEAPQFGYSLGTEKPVILLNTFFCYADNIRQPFARWSGTRGFAGITAINDQTGDGKPDLIITGGPLENGTIDLYTLDPAVSVDDDPVPPTVTSSARMTGDVLELSLAGPVLVSAHIVGIEGREAVLLAQQQYPAGTSRIDLAPLLRAYPRGAYYLRVRIGDASHTINIIR